LASSAVLRALTRSPEFINKSLFEPYHPQPKSFTLAKALSAQIKRTSTFFDPCGTGESGFQIVQTEMTLSVDTARQISEITPRLSPTTV
jgi:hypothetical protein